MSKVDRKGSKTPQQSLDQLDLSAQGAQSQQVQ